MTPHNYISSLSSTTNSQKALHLPTTYLILCLQLKLLFYLFKTNSQQLWVVNKDPLALCQVSRPPPPAVPFKTTQKFKFWSRSPRRPTACHDANPRKPFSHVAMQGTTTKAAHGGSQRMGSPPLECYIVIYKLQL